VSLVIEIVLFAAATAGCLATLALTWAIVKALGPFLDRWARITVLLAVGLPVGLGLAQVDEGVAVPVMGGVLLPLLGYSTGRAVRHARRTSDD
jgi:hypothetical protein